MVLDSLHQSRVHLLLAVVEEVEAEALQPETQEQQVLEAVEPMGAMELLTPVEVVALQHQRTQVIHRTEQVELAEAESLSFATQEPILSLVEPDLLSAHQPTEPSR